jgi:hypothetical protein
MTTKAVTIIRGEFYEPTKCNPPTHMVYSVSWADDVFIIDPYFVETKTSLMYHRLSMLDLENKTKFMRYMTSEIQNQYITNNFNSGILRCNKHNLVMVTAEFINAKINEFITIFPNLFNTEWKVPTAFTSSSFIPE